MKKSDLLNIIALIFGSVFALVITVISGIAAFSPLFNSAVAAMLIMYNSGLVQDISANSEALITAAENSRVWFTAIFAVAIIATAILLTALFLFIFRNKIKDGE